MEKIVSYTSDEIQEMLDRDYYQKQNRILEEMSDDDIDTSDIPEITDWTGWERGRYYRRFRKQ